MSRVPRGSSGGSPAPPTLPGSGRLLHLELPAAWAGRPPLERPRVLVVDDNRAHRGILLRHLQHWGLRAEAAPEGQAALAALRQAATAGEPFALAILDLAMPGMDGFALAEAVRQDPELADTRLILLTAFDAQGQAQAALRHGFSAYLTKPPRRTRLLALLQALLDPPPHPAPPASRPSARPRPATDGLPRSDAL